MSASVVVLFAAMTFAVPPDAGGLFEAVARGEVDRVVQIIDADGQSIHVRDAAGMTALHHATNEEHPALYKIYRMN